MAIQKGDIKFTGKLGGLVGRKVGEKYILSRPGGFSSERLKAGRQTNYKNVFTNATEFAASSKMASSIYRILKATFREAHFSKGAYNRLVAHFQNTRDMDTNNPKGRRLPTSASLARLRNFCLNTSATATWAQRPTMTVSNQEATIAFSNLSADIQWPFEADRLRITCLHIHTDIPQQSITKAHAHYLEIDRPDANNPYSWNFPIWRGEGGGQQSHTLTAIALQFFQVQNETAYSLNTESHNALHFLHFEA